VATFSDDIWGAGEAGPTDPLTVLRAPGGLYNTAKSAVRALYVLEILAAAGKPMRAVEIGARLGLSPSSADQILKTMVDSAHLIFNPITKLYFPSPRIARLGSSVAAHYFGDGALEGFLRAVHAAVGNRVTLSTALGPDMQVLAGLPAFRQTSFSRGPGSRASGRAYAPEPAAGVRVPVFRSSIGAAWLSAQDEKTVLATLRLCRRALGKAADDPAPILAGLERVRARGFAYGRISMDQGSSGLAMPLPATPAGIVLVVGASGPTQEMDVRLDDIVKLISAEIGRWLAPAAGKAEAS
jgi:DNA-binding IclR family transcriptional regulator